MGRRELLAALVGCTAGAVLALFAAGRVWAQAAVVEGPARPVVELTGRELAPAAPALALVGLAGALAVLATRAIGRRLAGLLLVLAGFGLAAAAVAGAGDAESVLAREAGAAVGTRTAPTTGLERSVWPWFAVTGGLLVAVAGGLTAVRGPSWPGMSDRYDAPRGGPPDRASDEPADVWSALDRGEDPTA